MSEWVVHQIYNKIGDKYNKYIKIREKEGYQVDKTYIMSYYRMKYKYNYIICFCQLYKDICRYSY